MIMLTALCGAVSGFTALITGLRYALRLRGKAPQGPASLPPARIHRQLPARDRKALRLAG
jgi:hypothetical protein